MKRSYSDLEQQQQHVQADAQYAAAPYSTHRGRQQSRQQHGNPQTAEHLAAAGAGKIKMCMQCGTTRTPQWREGPMGPKTLCNACGKGSCTQAMHAVVVVALSSTPPYRCCTGAVVDQIHTECADGLQLSLVDPPSSCELVPAGVKRVRALKAMQQGKGGHTSHAKKGAANRQSAAAAARTESMEVATTLQLLAGQATAPPPAKRQARAAHSAGGSSGRTKRTAALVAAHHHQQQQYQPGMAANEYESPAAGVAAAAAAAAAAGKTALLPSAVQKAIAAMAKGSLGGESNPTDSGEEISWSPNGHEPGTEAEGSGRPPLNPAAAAARRLQQQQQYLQDHEAAAAAGMGSLRHSSRRHHEQTEAEADEADAAANLLSISAAAEQPEHAVGAGKAAVRELVSALTAAQGRGAAAGSSRSRLAGSAVPPRHVVTVRNRSAAATSATAAALKEEDLLYLMGPGMQVRMLLLVETQACPLLLMSPPLLHYQQKAQCSCGLAYAYPLL